MVDDGCTGCCFDCGIEKMGMMEWEKGKRKKGGRKGGKG